MKKILVDSSVWISFFKGEEKALPLLGLIDSNRICVNDLILSELVPSLVHRNEKTLVDILYSIEKIKIDIDWQEIIQMQIENLKKGLNKVGIPDLIIAWNCIDNAVMLYSHDKHFLLMEKQYQIELYQPA